MGKMQRTKGHSFERTIAIALKAVFGENVKRGLGQARDAGEVSDVEGTPFWIECKAHKKVQIQRAFRQAIEAANGRRPVLVVSKDNFQPVLVTLELDTFLRMFAVHQSNKATPGPCAVAGCANTAEGDTQLCRFHA